MNILLEEIERTARQSNTLSQFCQQLDEIGIHPEVTTFRDKIFGIAYRLGEVWVAGKQLNPKYSLFGLQALGIVINEDDLSILRASNNVYQNLHVVTPPIKRAK